MHIARKKNFLRYLISNHWFSIFFDEIFTALSTHTELTPVKIWDRLGRFGPPNDGNSCSQILTENEANPRISSRASLDPIHISMKTKSHKSTSGFPKFRKNTSRSERSENFVTKYWKTVILDEITYQVFFSTYMHHIESSPNPLVKSGRP